MEIIIVYKSPKERQPGSEWDTLKCGKLKIIGKVANTQGKKYLIKFLNTGYECVVDGSHFSSGEIRDPMARLAQGIGYLGVGEHTITKKGKVTKEGHLWHNMLIRCYSEEYQNRTPTYKGCSVCERWQCFQDFCEDLPKLPGYEDWINNDNYALDKDSIVKGNKIYSPETCCFIYEGDNTTLSNISKNLYCGIDPNGNKYYFSNQREFAQQHNLTKGGISSVISGRQNSHRNWTFQKLSKDEIKELNGITQA